jgi:putative sterol carrier protein
MIGDIVTLKQLFEEKVEEFNKKIDESESLKKELAHLNKTFTLDLDTEAYSLTLENSKIKDFKPEALENADVVVTSTPETILALIEGDLRPMRAYITKKIRIKGKIQDLMFLKKFL